ncbi:MAG: 1-deoxy-D-xylulose-5-phosphate reductoisomerase [Candidatus Micrarchaeaceae archaeon]|jgi:1-deoxy-D-xylulose-5-phosphate reductoisomerase
MKRIAIYGSTGSIGTQTLEVVAELGNASVEALVCNSNVELLAEQIKKFAPHAAAVIDSSKEEELRERTKGTGTIIVSGAANAINICTGANVDLVVNSAVGIAGLVPTIRSIEAKKDVALANKESLVTGGHLVMRMAKENHVKIYPIDSEHSAIFQCLRGSDGNRVEELILTASGGPFRGYTSEMLRGVSQKQALNHPTWRMGGRITIDSATLMNKGFEVIEARWLFGIDPERIKVVVHPQSIIHSAVQYEDGSVIAQMGLPDMKLPIQYALNHPKRLKNHLKRLDLASIGRLDFQDPDPTTFRCLALAYEAIKMGGTAPAVLNGADEKAVEYFLKRRIQFTDIPKFIERALKEHEPVNNPSLDEILRADKWAKAAVKRYELEKYHITVRDDPNGPRIGVINVRSPRSPTITVVERQRDRSV